MLGLPTDVTTQVMVENEQAVYGDIVQGRFKDTYHNLTHKGLSSISRNPYHNHYTQTYVISIFFKKDTTNATILLTKALVGSAPAPPPAHK